MAVISTTIQSTAVYEHNHSPIVTTVAKPKQSQETGHESSAKCSEKENYATPWCAQLLDEPTGFHRTMTGWCGSFVKSQPHDGKPNVRKTPLQATSARHHSLYGTCLWPVQLCFGILVIPGRQIYARKMRRLPETARVVRKGSR